MENMLPQFGLKVFKTTLTKLKCLARAAKIITGAVSSTSNCYNNKSRLKRSVQFDKEIRINLYLEHNKFIIYPEPLFFDRNQTI